MKKKKILLTLIDKVFWLLIMLIPVIAYLVMPLGFSIGGGSEGVTDLPTFAEALTQFGLNENNVIYGALNDLFGASGLLPMFANNSALLLYFTYLVIVELVHLFIDFIVFIPRLAHKFLNVLCQSEEE